MCCSTLTYWQGTGRRFGSRMWVCCCIAEERRAMARRLSHCVVNTDRGEWRKMGWRVSDRLLYVNDQRLVPAETFRKTGRLHGGLTKSFRCRKKRRQRHLMGAYQPTIPAKIRRTSTTTAFFPSFLSPYEVHDIRTLKIGSISGFFYS